MSPQPATQPLRTLPAAEPSRRKPAQPARTPAVWVQGMFLFQFACQLLMVLVDMGPLRAAMRVAVFGVSLVFLTFLPGRGRLHPAGRAAVGVVGLLAAFFFHPETNGILGGLAQIGFNLAVLSPLFWGPRIKIDSQGLRKVLLIIWAFHTASSAVGVLQVYFPGRFQPNLSQMISSQGEGYVESLTITTASGERTFRPMGLTDTPGGASMSGFYAFMLGVGFFLMDRRWAFRAVCAFAMFLGITALYLSYVRSVLVLLGVCIVCMAVVLALRGEVKRLTAFAAMVGAVASIGFSVAAAIGGEGLVNRVSTLLDDNPSEVYDRNRGHFLRHTLELAPEYPLGIGLGRWGMMSVYFGDNVPLDPKLWVEIQWTGWLLDGGIPLMLAYGIAVLAALWVAFLVAMGRMGGQHANLWMLGMIVFAYDVGGLALTFNFPFFASQAGLEFWVMNALLFSAAMLPGKAAPTSKPKPRLRLLRPRGLPA